jgi:phage shock protein C
MAYNRLYRSSTNSMIAGVAGGFGEYFNIDPVIIRVIFVALFLGFGSGLLLYLLLWIIVPKQIV